MNDHDLLLKIQELLDGVEWSPGTFEEIAFLMSESGYEIRDFHGLSYATVSPENEGEEPQ